MNFLGFYDGKRCNFSMPISHDRYKMRFFSYGKSKIILKNKFNYLQPVFSNHLDTIDGIYSHSLEKSDFFCEK